jgi:two-component system LytT family response regulator
MPRLDGFEVLELIPSEIAVVFVTAYDEYALKAFEVNAVDYLLKPFTADRLKDALARARERRVAPGEKREPDPADLARAARPEGEFLTRVVIKDGAQIQVVGVERVDFLMAQGDYVAVHADGKSHLKQQTMQSLSDSLDPARFVRIHRSYVLNLDRLARIEPYGRDSKIAVLADGTELPVSRSGYTRLRALLD